MALLFMKQNINLKSLVWVNKPKRYIQNEDKIIIETEPFTELKHSGSGAEAIELALKPVGNFHFTIRVDYEYKKAFDQCGIVLYHKNKKKAVIGTEKRDGEISKLFSIVFHEDGSDRSVRDIGSAIGHLYYRVWMRGRQIRIQYGFHGTKYSTLREFEVMDDEPVHIGIYACSPADSYFDCTFSKAELSDESQL